ncbi:DUF423 domain-containing protein [Bremerella sp. JC770]|uniref:DUF423 domain-containing protein n=1 Tax=Bremerella sp. JC770 TaxID=3232137 RepID=UPI00345965A0
MTIHYNLLLGAVFGVVLVTSGPIAEPYFVKQFEDDLKSKAVEVPGDMEPDGTRGKPYMMISEIDRQESAQRWQKYQDGIRYLAIHAVALSVLGLSMGKGWPQLIGGIGFSLGTLLFACGTAFGAVLDMPTLAVFAPMGAIFLLVGWLGLLLSAIKIRTTTQSKSA